MLRKVKLKRPITKRDERDILESKHGKIEPVEKEVKRKKTPEDKILERLFGV